MDTGGMSYESSYRLRARNAKGEALRLWADVETSELVENLTVKEAYQIMEAHRSGLRYVDNGGPVADLKPIRNRIADFELIGPMGHKEIVTRDMIDAPKASTESAEATADPGDDEFPQGTCVICAAPILYVHAMWIGVDGREHCDGTDVPHAVALGHDENVAAMREASLKLPLDALIRMTEQAARNLDIAGRHGDRGAYRMALGTLREAIALTYPDVDRGAVEDLWSEIGGTVAAAVARLRGHVDPDPELVTVTMESVPVQVCPCGMMPGARFHKRHCPAQEARGVVDTFIPATERKALASMLLKAPWDEPATPVDAAFNAECLRDMPVRRLPVAWPMTGLDPEVATVAEKRARMRRWNRRIKPSLGTRNRKAH